ncbi:Cannabinoid receptor type 1B [Chionoecetes opilio]|uniref:Cannabinoid receptor type 1B n=1 Tax=Chionoecetes opilio TaxID=41210 RepID=A0A8J5CKR2_CHIOP|nr:Cannabinoid receptor type 1B [Chionoecetes opilio]
MTPRQSLREEGGSGSFLQSLVTTATSLLLEAANQPDETAGNGTNNNNNILVAAGGLRRRMPLPFQVLITILYIMGILGNMAALYIITRSETQRYRKQHVTHSVIRRSILILWLVTLLLVCLPFLGFGLWYDEDLTPSCVRYRYGTDLVDRVYAYVIFTYGMVMCLVIVYCNLSVIRVLCSMRNRLMPRRHSHASRRSNVSTSKDSAVNLATPEELSFARLMAIFSITFVACWVPQLMTIIAGQVIGNDPQYKTFYRIPDVFILLNFCLDPFMYVLFRRNRRYGSKHLRKLFSYLCPHLLRPSPSQGILTDSLRSSSHTSQNSNGHFMGGITVSSSLTTNENYVSNELLLLSACQSKPSATPNGRINPDPDRKNQDRF